MLVCLPETLTVTDIPAEVSVISVQGVEDPPIIPAMKRGNGNQDRQQRHEVYEAGVCPADQDDLGIELPEWAVEGSFLSDLRGLWAKLDSARQRYAAEERSAGEMVTA